MQTQTNAGANRVTVYQVVNTRTGAVVAKCSSAQRARNRRDALDTVYGASVHIVRAA